MDLLTDEEQHVIQLAADLAAAIAAAIPAGPNRVADLNELLVPVHHIQHAFMAQAAARAMPELYRPLGGSSGEPIVVSAVSHRGKPRCRKWTCDETENLKHCGPFGLRCPAHYVET